MTIDYKLIGKRLKAHRRKMRITQAVLAESVDVSDTYISRIETGAKKASLSSLAKIAHVLGISLDAIVLGSVTDNVFASYLQLSELLADCTDSERKTIIDAAVKYKRYLRNPG